MSENLIWSEKYRPKNIQELLGVDNNIKLISKWINDIKLSKNKEKCLLLHGPPGVGKTTMATLILNHFNYDSIEFNASDIRNKSLVKEKITQIINKSNILQMMVSAKKRLGIIMDEVDGMSGGEKGGITELLNILSIGKSKKDKSKSKKKKPDTETKIKTPVICICNNISDKKLKDLKAKSLVIKVSKPNNIFLQRLLERILTNENIEIDDISKKIILTKSQGDYRRLVCLLEYLFSNNRDKTSQEDIERAIENFFNKNIEITSYDSVDKLLNIYTNLDKAYQYYEIDKNLISMLIFENFPNTITKNRKDTNEKKLEIMSKIYSSYAEGDNYDYNIYVNQHWTLNDFESNSKAIYPSYLLNKELNKYAFNKQTDIKFSTLLNKTSLEFLNYRNFEKINNNMNITSNNSTHKDHCDILCNYLFHEKEDFFTKGIEMLKYYNLKIEDVDKLIKHSNKYTKQLYTTKLKKKITIHLNKNIISI